MVKTHRPGIAYNYGRGTFDVRCGSRIYRAVTYAIAGGKIGVVVQDVDDGSTAHRVARYVLAEVAPELFPVRVYRRTDLPGTMTYDGR